MEQHPVLSSEAATAMTLKPDDTIQNISLFLDKCFESKQELLINRPLLESIISQAERFFHTSDDQLKNMKYTMEMTEKNKALQAEQLGLLKQQSTLQRRVLKLKRQAKSMVQQKRSLRRKIEGIKKKNSLLLSNQESASSKAPPKKDNTLAIVQANSLSDDKSKTNENNSNPGPSQASCSRIHHLTSNSVSLRVLEYQSVRLYPGVDEQLHLALIARGIYDREQIANMWANIIAEPIPLITDPLPQCPFSPFFFDNIMITAPALRIKKNRFIKNHIFLFWSFPEEQPEDIIYYELYHYASNSVLPALEDRWEKLGNITPLDLPMQCTIELPLNKKYYFIIRAVDKENRLGPLSNPVTIQL